MIHTCIPFRNDTNLGRAYNDVMELIGLDDWACFLDHDVMFTTFEWYRQLEAAIRFEPRGTFTGVTNRIYCPWQRANEADPQNHDIMYHRKIGAERLKNRYLTDVTQAPGRFGLGGFILCISKHAWLDAGGFVDGQLCVDHNMHFALRRIGRPVYLIEGLYMYHYARGAGEKYKDITMRAECECRVPVSNWAPTERRIIPC